MEHYFSFLRGNSHVTDYMAAAAMSIDSNVIGDSKGNVTTLEGNAKWRVGWQPSSGR